MMYMIPEDNYWEALKILTEAFCEASEKGNYEMAKLTYEVHELLTAEKKKVKDDEKTDSQSIYLEETETRLDVTINALEYIASCLRGYKAITDTGGCNECADRKTCSKRPKWGQIVRYSCMFFKRENNE